MLLRANQRLHGGHSISQHARERHLASGHRLAGARQGARSLAPNSFNCVCLCHPATVFLLSSANKLTASELRRCSGLRRAKLVIRWGGGRGRHEFRDINAQPHNDKQMRSRQGGLEASFSPLCACDPELARCACQANGRFPSSSCRRCFRMEAEALAVRQVRIHPRQSSLDEARVPARLEASWYCRVSR